MAYKTPRQARGWSRDYIVSPRVLPYQNRIQGVIFILTAKTRQELYKEKHRWTLLLDIKEKSPKINRRIHWQIGIDNDDGFQSTGLWEWNIKVTLMSPGKGMVSVTERFCVCLERQGTQDHQRLWELGTWAISSLHASGFMKWFLGKLTAEEKKLWNR